MVVTQHRSRRKASGARYKSGGKSKRQYEAGSKPTLTKIGEKQLKTIRTLGGNKKLRLAHADLINVMDPKTKKCTQVKMKNVIDCPANKQYARQNILTKGTIVETDAGNAKITNRPAQDGCVSGILVK
jgi:small subunit ribosomal protein S8e